MRVFVFTVLAGPLLAADGILLYNLPTHVGGYATRTEGWILLAGGSAYVLMHLLLRKPERLYLWAHEFAHLAAAKLFLRKIHQFHISSRNGGKVVMDGTNVVIDLAPYIFPLYSIAALGLSFLLRPASPHVPTLYLALAAFLYTMHLFFSVEGFVEGQPDVKRSGRPFSAGIVLLSLQLWIPCLLAPGVASGWNGALVVYRGWFEAARATAGNLFLYGLSFF